MADIGSFRVSVQGVLDDLGVEVASDRSDNLICLCPLHEDNRPSFAIHAETGKWICYADCGAGVLQQLVAKVLDIPWNMALGWLEERGERLGSRDSVLNLVFGEEERFDGPDESSLFYEAGTTYQYMVNRGFTAKTLKAWSVGKDSSTRAVIIPIHFNHQLRGLISRFIDNVPGRKPYEYSGGLRKKDLLFGWDMLMDVPDNIVVVEGPLDVLWLWQHGYQSVALLGSRISGEQVDLLVRRTRTAVLALDSDQEGRQGTERAIRVLSGRINVMTALLPPGKKDVQECTDEELHLVMNNTTSGLFFRKEPYN